MPYCNTIFNPDLDNIIVVVAILYTLYRFGYFIYKVVDLVYTYHKTLKYKEKILIKLDKYLDKLENPDIILNSTIFTDLHEYYNVNTDKKNSQIKKEVKKEKKYKKEQKEQFKNNKNTTTRNIDSDISEDDNPKEQKKDKKIKSENNENNHLHMDDTFDESSEHPIDSFDQLNSA
jgi:hypothetical protein